MTSVDDHATARLSPPPLPPLPARNSGVKEILPRSPHPYHRRSESIKQLQSIRSDDAAVQRDAPESSSPLSSSSSTEGGTEADDEKGPILRGLPAPPLRARKGLKGSRTPTDLTPAVSPFPTSPASSETRASYFPLKKEKSSGQVAHQTQAENVRLYEKYVKRRRAEVGRRFTEVVLFGLMGWNACRDTWSQGQLVAWEVEIRAFFAMLALLYALYPVRTTLHLLQNGSGLPSAARVGFHIPSRFDPGTLLYPICMPFFIAAVLTTANSAFVVTNLVLGLSSLPSAVIPSPWSHSSSLLHWIITLLPVTSSRWPGYTTTESDVPIGIRLSRVSDVSPEMLSLLYPLHQILVDTLRYLSTTSLDPAELQLLSTGLINLFLFASAPQAQILKALMWLGSLCLLTSCRWALRLELALARIPAWKFARNKAPKSGLLSRVESVLDLLLPRHRYNRLSRQNRDDEDYHHIRSNWKSSKSGIRLRKINTQPFMSHTSQIVEGDAKQAEAAPANVLSRSTTDSVAELAPLRVRTDQRRRSIPASRVGLLSLTLTQAQACKWLLAVYTYIAVVLVILVLIRHYVRVWALFDHEPVGWALGYLFGNVPRFRWWVVSNNLERWIALPARVAREVVTWDASGGFERWRQVDMGPANVRLCIVGYCLAVLSLGIGVVVRLRSVVEVDTRRKVFHGIMVVMLLPTIIVDPCFMALALTLMLALFLLLDLFRACQLPPVSKPLTIFLAPYVDGRDHRGPVIVSPIFLLIGCAIPLWLSLAGSPRTGVAPWAGWDTPARDLSMVSGVVCVGMGDAAASLIGRRYGRTKWFWGGGKSLEGSLAFAVAVTMGLWASYLWLRLGGWAAWEEASALPQVTIKAAVAAMGASLLESSLTAANDNVVVPVGLWLLVRGLDI